MSDDEEWLEDFGFNPTEAELRALLERVEGSGNQDLRRLTKMHRTLRRAAADVLVYLDSKGWTSQEDRAMPGKAMSSPIALLRFVLGEQAPSSD